MRLRRRSRASPSVVDGDTISIGETRIRLEGIDAPESRADLQAQMVRLVGLRDRGDRGAAAA